MVSFGGHGQLCMMSDEQWTCVILFLSMRAVGRERRTLALLHDGTRSPASSFPRASNYAEWRGVTRAAASFQ
ncbi:hypothetical protein Dimus_036143, partial [Dionaea muscipula]